LGRGRSNQRQFLGNFKAGESNEPGYRRGVEARGVKLDAEGARYTIESEAADAVDVAGMRQREGCLLRRRSVEAVENFHRGHRDMIARQALRISAVTTR